MKRADALRPLSRDHYAALIAAKNLRELHDPIELRRFFLEFWHGDGARHFRIEEEVLLPGWALHSEVNQAAVARMLDEHLLIRREALRVEVGEAPLDQLREIGKYLAEHVRFEEEELFPLIEAALDPETLARLATAIERAESGL